ncbi:MAG: NUDIX hydrolase, partial [Nanoarchaeota archaeon]|nr:NUDIX hydrolase [Nanoarchaeota archaeon]
YQGGIVLIDRKNPPYGWAIPGGFVDIGETVEDAAVREAKEETNLELTELKQFHTYSDPKRDPRGHTISIVFTAKGSGELKGMDDAKLAKVFTNDNLPELAFDHEQILNDYFEGKYGEF